VLSADAVCEDAGDEGGEAELRGIGQMRARIVMLILKIGALSTVIRVYGL